MQELCINKKMQVVKLFLGGTAYDDIAQQTGIAKGSVVNIVNEFREGSLPAPPGMAEYIDALRQLAVDLLKHQTSVAQLKGHLKLHSTLQDMGVTDEQADKWLAICSEIASDTVDNNGFVQAALELAGLKAESGMTYKAVLEEYEGKAKEVLNLDKEIGDKEKRLEELGLKYKEEADLATKQLNSITKAANTAQANYEKQEAALGSKLKEYLAHNQLSWQKVNTVVAILNTELSSTGLSQDGIEEISKKIASMGSLTVMIRGLELKREELTKVVKHLVQQEDAGKQLLAKTKAWIDEATVELATHKIESIQMEVGLEATRAKLAELQRFMSEIIHDMYLTHLITIFLFDPSCMSAIEVDDFINLMIGLRQKRLGIGPKQVKDNNGKIICECPVPELINKVDTENIDLEQVRVRLACYLIPLVKDKFVSIWKHQAAGSKIAAEFAETVARLRGCGLMYPQ